ncbi:hypothetical protein B566_EDAN001932 [Ephemera danica]|nr:hypothetical protein B566_EDAN001932 [Ephemera danica]
MEEAAKDTMQTNQLDCASDDEHLESFPPNIRSEALQVMHQLLKRHDERMNQNTDSMDEEPEVTSQAFQNLVSSESDSSDQEIPDSEQQNLVLPNNQQTSKAQDNSVPEVDTDKENESL